MRTECTHRPAHQAALNRPGFGEGKTLGELPIMEHTKKKTSKPHSPEFSESALGLMMEHRDEYQSEVAALTAIAGKLGCSPGSHRNRGGILCEPQLIRYDRLVLEQNPLR